MAFISQTGIGARRLITRGNRVGIRFSKTASYGNAIDLDAPDFLEYLVDDSETKYVICYIEGVKDGQRFFAAMKKCAQNKPVVLLKGGLTESGAGATLSHTGSLSGSKEIWSAFIHQTGVIPVGTFEEAECQLLALTHLVLPKGSRVGVVGRGGGPGVVASDMCERVGLSVPELLPETRGKLAKITVAGLGSSIRNPVEIGLGPLGIAEHYAEALKIVGADPQIDIVIAHLDPDGHGLIDPDGYGLTGSQGGWTRGVMHALLEAKTALLKPLALVIVPGQTAEAFASTLEFQNKCLAEGLAVFPSMDAAVKAMAKLAQYYKFISQRKYEKC